MWSYRPPSSIHLRDSIENCLDMSLPNTPDNIDSPGLHHHPRTAGYHHPQDVPDSPELTLPWKARAHCRKNSHRSRWRSGPFSRNPSSSSQHRYFSSTSDLQSLQEYHDTSELQQQQQQQQRNSQDSMTFSTASELSLDGAGASPRRLLRSNSDSLSVTGCGTSVITASIPRDLSFPSGYESAESDRVGYGGKDEWKQMFDSKRKVQTLLNDINDLCTETSD